MVCSLLDFLIQMGICLSSCFTFYFHFFLSLFVLFSHKSKIRNRVDLFFCNHATYSHHLYHLNFIPFPSYPFPLFLIFSCPEQLNRWPCHSLTHSLLLLPYKEQSKTLATMALNGNFWGQCVMIIFDDYFWWQFLMTIFDDNFWWQFLMTIFDDSFWWQFLLTIIDDNFWHIWQFSTILNFLNFFWQF